MTAQDVIERLRKAGRPYEERLTMDDWIFDGCIFNEAADVIERLHAQNERMEKALNTPELHDFSAGVVSEAQHQRERWGTDSDAGKTPADWFWLVGYLAGKALTAANVGNTDKALHHCISTAAALANWHAALSGSHSGMRPGIEEPQP